MDPIPKITARSTSGWPSARLLGHDARGRGRGLPGLEWHEWYEAGLTVEQAVERANRRVYGG